MMKIIVLHFNDSDNFVRSIDNQITRLIDELQINSIFLLHYNQQRR